MGYGVLAPNGFAIPMPPMLGGGGTYTATHYVDTATNVGQSNDYRNQGATAFSNATSPGTAVTLGTAVAHARAGDVVRLAPGQYIGSGSGTNGGWSVAFNPTNSGTSGNPIVFFAQFRPGTTYQPGTTTEVRSGSTSVGSCNAFGADERDYIIWDGIYTDATASNNCTTDGTAPVVLHDTDGSEIRYCSIIGGRAPWSVDNNWAAIQMNRTGYCAVRDCFISGFAGDRDSSVASNSTGITMYSVANSIVEHCRFTGCDSASYVKGETAGAQHGITWRYCYIDDFHYAGLYINAMNGGAQNSIYGCVVDGSTAGADVQCMQFGNNEDYANINIVNNTFYRAGESVSMRAGSPGESVHTGIYWYNNIFLNPNRAIFHNLRVGADYPNTAQQLIDMGSSGLTLDYNCYYMNGGEVMFLPDRTTPAQWRALSGSPDRNSVWQDPQLADPANGDFSSTADTPLGYDLLNLTGNGVGAPIVMGAYWANGVEIGQRQMPTYQ